MGKTVVRTEAAPAPFQGAPYSQAIVAGGFVFVSGQVALEPGHTELMGGTIGEQTEQVFANLRAILEAAGSGLDQLVKTTVYLAEPRRLRRHERGLLEARRRPAAGAGDVRGGGPARGRARRDRGHRSRLSRRRGTISVPCGPRPIIATHANTDFDAFASMLAVRRLYPGSVVCVSGSLNRNVRELCRLYADELELVRGIATRARRRPPADRRRGGEREPSR